MSNIALVLKPAEGNTIARYDLNTARVEQIDAVNGAYYQFTDAATGTGPVRIDTARSGDGMVAAIKLKKNDTYQSPATYRFVAKYYRHITGLFTRYERPGKTTA